MEGIRNQPPNTAIGELKLMSYYIIHAIMIAGGFVYGQRMDVGY